MSELKKSELHEIIRVLLAGAPAQDRDEEEEYRDSVTIAQLRAQVVALEDALADKEDDVSSLQNQLRVSEDTLERVRVSARELAVRNEKLTEQNEKLAPENERLQRTVDAQNAHIGTLEAKVVELQSRPASGAVRRPGDDDIDNLINKIRQAAKEEYPGLELPTRYESRTGWAWERQLADRLHQIIYAWFEEQC